MQPQRAPRGIAAVAVSTAALGLLLLTLAVVLSGCGSSSAAATRTSATASTPPPASTPSSSASGSPTPSASAGSATGGPTSAAPGAGTSPTDAGTGVVPSVPVTTAPAVPITAAAPAAGGGRITIGAISSLQGQAQLPGERNGPAVRVPVSITNGTTGPLDLSQVVVDLVDAAGVSAGQLSAAPAAPFDGTLAPRATASAVYVFSLAESDRSNVKILVSYTTAAPVVVFTGSIA